MQPKFFYNNIRSLLYIKKNINPQKYESSKKNSIFKQLNNLINVKIII